MVRFVVLSVLVLAFLRRIKQGRRGKRGLGVIATAGLGMAGAVIGGVIGDAAVSGSGIARDLTAGFAAVLGAVLLVAVGEVVTRRSKKQRAARR